MKIRSPQIPIDIVIMSMKEKKNSTIPFKIHSQGRIICTPFISCDPVIFDTYDLAVDMESYGIATAVRYANTMSPDWNVKLLPICKAISDIVGENDQQESRHKQRDIASINASFIAIDYIRFRFFFSGRPRIPNENL